MSREDIGGQALKHQASFRTGVRPSEVVDLDMWFRYVDDYRTNRNSNDGLKPYEIEACLTLDMRLSWRPSENLELTVSGRNLPDEGHLEYVQEILFLPTEVPRRFYGQVKYSF